MPRRRPPDWERAFAPREQWDRRPMYPPPAPKLPPPAHGIKVSQFGSTWWGERWIDALERLGAVYWSRLRNGRGYARQGRVHDLAIEQGSVRALVTGTRSTPYDVTIELTPLTASGWSRALKAMSRTAAFTARLLEGEMPPKVAEVFEDARADLFPATRRELRTACTCPDTSNPCKHVAALHYVLAEAFDRDPFLLFELRGRPRAAILADLRAARAAAGERSASPSKRRRAGRGATAGDPARARDPEPEGALGFDGAPHAADSPPAAVALPHAYEELQGPVDALRFHIGHPEIDGATLRQLGVPRSWRLKATPRQLLQGSIHRAAAVARAMALGEERSGPR